VATKHKLDLNLSPSYFVTPVSNGETQEIFVFENQVDDDSRSTSSGEHFTSLDDCIDQSRQRETFSVASLI